MRTCMLVLLFGLAMTGCATVAARSSQHGEKQTSGVYPATRMDAGMIATPFDPDAKDEPAGRRWGRCGLGLIDLPVSLISDTVCLPYDLLADESQK